MPEDSAAILSVGMITSVGIDSKQTAASVRAGITRFSETSIYNKQFQPFVMANLPDDVLPLLEPELDKVVDLTTRQSRMLRLATPALQETVENALRIEDTPLYLGVPEPLPERPNPVEKRFIEHLSVQSGVRFNVAESELFPKGRAAGLTALKQALQDCLSEKHEYVLVGGVDTYVALYLLGTLDMENRILGEGVMDGFIPGEGAGFLLISSFDKASEYGAEPLALLSSVSTGQEDGHLYSAKPYQGTGLADTFENVFQDSDIAEPAKEVYSSMNGENHWAKEWGVAFMRNQTSFDSNHKIHHPAECFGDTGAASGILMTGLSALAMNQGYGQSPSLVYASSDYGERAALLLSST